jgi:hypothetical protein
VPVPDVADEAVRPQHSDVVGQPGLTGAPAEGGSSVIVRRVPTTWMSS